MFEPNDLLVIERVLKVNVKLGPVLAGNLHGKVLSRCKAGQADNVHLVLSRDLVIVRRLICEKRVCESRIGRNRLEKNR